MQRRRGTSLVLLMVALALAAGGCAGARELPPGGSAPDPQYLCQGEPISRSILDARTPVSELTEPGRSALDDAVYDDLSPLRLDDPDSWFVVRAADEALVLMRDLDEPDIVDESTAPRDHELVSIEWIEATNFGPGWLVTSQGYCALAIDLGELEAPAVRLDPDNPPDGTSRELHLLVTEQACNSGEDADGRVELVSRRESASRVELVIGIRPRGGAQNCPTNPPTPFIVMLEDPLGDRTILDGSLATPRELTLEQ